MREELEVIRNLLDKQVVDCDGTKMGRADGVVLEIGGDGPPRVAQIQMGFAVLARRLSPRIEQWLNAIRQRWSVRKSARQIVPWEKVVDVTNNEIKLDLKAIDTPAFDWERWLRDRIVARIPGSTNE